MSFESKEPGQLRNCRVDVKDMIDLARVDYNVLLDEIGRGGISVTSLTTIKVARQARESEQFRGQIDDRFQREALEGLKYNKFLFEQIKVAGITASDILEYNNLCERINDESTDISELDLNFITGYLEKVKQVSLAMGSIDDGVSENK